VLQFQSFQRAKRSAAEANDLAPMCQLKPLNYVETEVVLSVGWTAANSGAYSPYRRRRLEDVPRNCRRRVGEGNRCRPTKEPRVFCGLTSGHINTALPNPSFEARPNGKPPSPGHGYGVHYPWPGLGVLPSVPPQLER